MMKLKGREVKRMMKSYWPSAGRNQKKRKKVHVSRKKGKSSHQSNVAIRLFFEVHIYYFVHLLVFIVS